MVVAIAAVDNHRRVALPCDGLDLGEQLPFAVVAAAGVVALVFGQREFARLDDLMADADLLGHVPGFFEFAGGQARTDAGNSHGPIAQGKLRRLGQQRAIEPSGEGHRATAEALEQPHQAVAFFGNIGGEFVHGKAQKKGPPPQCRGDVLLRAREFQGGTWTPGCVIRYRPKSVIRLYTRPESFVQAPNGLRIGSPKLHISSTRMAESHWFHLISLRHPRQGNGKNITYPSGRPPEMPPGERRSGRLRSWPSHRTARPPGRRRGRAGRRPAAPH